MPSYCRKVAEGENAQQTRFAARSIADDDQLPTGTGKQPTGTNWLDQYEPMADALCQGIIQKLESASQMAEETGEVTALSLNTLLTSAKESRIRSIVFVAQVADELNSSSDFISTIGCSDVAAAGAYT